MSLYKKEFSAIITAAGNSTRMGNKKKEYLPLPNSNKNITVISETIFKFLHTKIFSTILVTVPKLDIMRIENIIFKDTRISEELKNTHTKLAFISGGHTRQASVYNALVKLEKSNSEFVLVHDGARPWITEALIKTVCHQTQEKGSAIPATNAVDTQKVIDKDGKIIKHLERSSIYSVQTPQGFNFNKLLSAHKIAIEHTSKKEYTDDSEIYSLLDENIFICKGEIQNKKITYKEDVL